MIKNVLAFLLLVNTLQCYSQMELKIGKTDTLYSNILNEKRALWVSVPTDFNKYVSEKAFPVVFVLDGPDHFISTVGMIDRFSESAQCPPMIVVGIVHKDREKDFYSSGEDKFAQFLSNELIPFIDKNYPTKPFRTLIGHSLGGLSAVKMAIQNELFQQYIVIDPSLGHERNKWFDLAKEDMKKLQLNNKRMYVAMAQTMPYGKVQDLVSIKKDTSGSSNHMRKIMDFSEIMVKKNTKSDISFDWKFYPNEDHGSVPLIAIFDGLKFLFHWYPNANLDKMLDESTTPQKAVDLTKAYYELLSKKLGYPINPPVNPWTIDYLFTRKKQKEKALALAEYNLACYPNNKGAQNWVVKIKKALTLSD